MSAGDSDAVARLGDAAGVDDAEIAAGAAGAGGAGAEGAGAAGAGAGAAGAGGAGAEGAGAASAGAGGAGGAEGADGIAAAAAPFVEVIEVSVDPAPEMPGAADAEDAAISAAVFKIADDLRAFADAERLVAAVQNGEAASLAEAVRIRREQLDAQQGWPTLGDAKQHPKRRRSTVPAPKAASFGGGPDADAAPEDPSSGDLEGRDIPAGQPSIGQEVPDGGQEAPSPAAAQAEFEGRVQEILAGGGDTPQEEPAPASPIRFVRFEGPPSPGDVPMEQAPELPAVEVEVIPSKAMPKLPPAGAVRPNPYRDFRLVPPAAGPSPEFVAAFDRQMAAEREARFFTAWREQVAFPQAQPPMPTTEAVAAFIAWQAR